MHKKENLSHLRSLGSGIFLKGIPKIDDFKTKKTNVSKNPEDCSISNLIPFPVWVLSLQKSLIFFNKAFLILWGFTKEEEMEKRQFKEITGESFAQMCFVMSDQVLNKREEIENKHWIMDGQRRQRFFNIKALPRLSVHNEIEFIIFSAMDCTSFEDENDRIRRAGQIDSLTELFNRSAFDQKIASVEKKGTFPLAIAVADVDNLKEVNDNQGHSAGDELIKACGKILRESFRGDDFVARIGGDEFCVIFSGYGLKTVEKIIKRIEQEKDRANIEFSIGWDIKRFPTESVQEVFKRADENMYRQKFLKKGVITSNFK